MFQFESNKLNKLNISSAMAVTRAMPITLVLALITSGVPYPNTVEEREPAKNETLDARDEV